MLACVAASRGSRRRDYVLWPVVVRARVLWRYPLILDRVCLELYFFFFSSRRRHTRCSRDWSSDVCSSDLAGHIDHGKTALVKALTGVDTDRWEEEKRRGITIDLGFAPLPLGDAMQASVVDVPGHEGFVRNMLAGATGIDVALLVIAADEGIMPQTEEHLAIVELLGA